MLPDEGDDDPFHSSDHPNEPELPGEDNAGERLIRKYDPTIGSGGRSEGSAEPDFGDVDVDDETARMFWYLVLVFNLALMALAIGLMMIVFLDDWFLGGQITAAGALMTAYGYYRYRKHQKALEASRAESEDPSGDGNG